jgi:hypothetical protein
MLHCCAEILLPHQVTSVDACTVLDFLFQNENGIAVEDRVAFACTFLSDAKLKEYLKQLTTKLTEEGDLAGILLTGLCSLCFIFMLQCSRFVF